MERSVTHSTFIIERSYPATPQRVFNAFSDPAKKRRWFAEGEESKLEEYEADFRVGGSERTQFRFNDAACVNNTVYLDIQPNSRIVFVYTMTLGDYRFSSSQATVEFFPTATGTSMIFTEQAAFFEKSDGPKIREQGWRLLLEQLAHELAR
jgi:uncharacterized protein YndB with AHSA1/START domain